jgi:hypothetical protein
MTDSIFRRWGEPVEDDWFDYQLQTDPRFERGIEAARRSLRAGEGVKLEDVDLEN